MSVLFTLNDCLLVSHEKFINQIYRKHIQTKKDGTQISYRMVPELFDLNVPYRTESDTDVHTKKHHRKAVNKKINQEISENQEEYELIERLKLKTKEFLVECQKNGFIVTTADDTPKDNSKLKKFLTQWNDSNNKNIPTFYAENPINQLEITKLNDKQYLIPPKCAVYCKSIDEINWNDLKDSYDFIVIDPPWWNKYIRRTKQFREDNGYQMLSNDLIEKIPIERLTQANKTIVAIWCTNAPSLIKTVIESFIPKWNLKLISTWYWIKITKSGETICDFNLPLKKQPFERLFIACPIASEQQIEMPKENYIFSIPSAIHSHKPPLEELLTPYLTQTTENSKSLEIFSRYLLPQWTSIGLEAIKLQDIRLFQVHKIS